MIIKRADNKYKFIYIYIYEFIKRHALGCLFVFFLCIYFTFGLFLTINNEKVTYYAWDVVYSLDSGYTYNILTVNSFAIRARHLLEMFFIKPLFDLFSLFIKDDKQALILLQAIIQSGAVCLVYKTLLSLNIKKNLSFLFSLLFGFSFASLLYSSMPEIYVWAGFFQICLFYSAIQIIKTKKLNFRDILLFSLLLIPVFSINIINGVFGIFLLIFSICKIFPDDYKKFFVNLFKILILSAVLIFSFAKIQSLLYDIPHDECNGIEMVYNLKKFREMTRGTFVEPFYALSSGEKISEWKKETFYGNMVLFNRWLVKDNQNPINFLPAILLFFPPLFYFFKKRKEYENKDYIYFLSSVIFLYSMFNMFFCSYECSLYALNYLCLFVILLCLLYSKMPYAKAKFIITAFIFSIIIINFVSLFLIQSFLQAKPLMFSFLQCFLISLMTTFVCYLIFGIYKQIIKKTNVLYCAIAYFFYNAMYFIVLYLSYQV